MSAIRGFESVQIVPKPPIFNPSEYFAEWDYYEPYDSLSSYGHCVRDLGFGMREYKWTLVEFNKEEQYAVAHRIYKAEYIKAIAMFCPCAVCNSFLFKMIRIRFGSCKGCLRGNPVFVRERFVKLAEAAMADQYGARMD